MGTQSHAHLNEDDITEHLHLCDTSELNLKNVVEKRHAANARKTACWDNMIIIQLISMIRKQSSYPKVFPSTI